MKILFYGDSITDMGRFRDRENGSVHSYGNGYVFLVTSELQSKFPNEYEIINRGISGNRSVDLYARIKSDCWNFEPDVISILIGVNDVWHELSNQNGVEIERFEEIYRIMIRETKKRLPNTKIILCEPFILKGEATEYLGYEKFLQVKDYALVVRKLAKEFDLPIVLLQDKFDEVAEKYGVKNYLFDGVHPNVAGAKLIADEWLKTFYNLTK